jgi:hypothetical protein
MEIDFHPGVRFKIQKGKRMNHVNVKEFGAVGDGTRDDTSAIQGALDRAQTNGSTCYLPSGHYRVEGPLTVPSGVTMRGASGGVPHSEHPIGTVLLAYGGRGDPEGDPLVTLKSNAGIRNLIIHYPEQDIHEVVPYPWSIRGDGELCQVTDIMMTNPYRALDFGTCWNELHTVRNVFACPLDIGVYVDQCTDIGRLENVHFNPNFWTRMAVKPGHPADTAAVKAYQEAHLIGFKIGKTDWEYITNSFVIFPKIGFHFDDFGHGPGNAVVTQSGGDICPVAVRVDQVQPHAGVQFVNGQFMATLVVGAHNEGPVKLANCGFWGTPETRSHILKHGPSTLTLNGCHFNRWDAEDQGAPCLEADGGRLIISGCDFGEEHKRQIELKPGLTAASIVGNALRGEDAILNDSDADVQIGLNTT